MKKFLALALALIMVLSLFTACGQKEDAAAPESGSDAPAASTGDNTPAAGADFKVGSIYINSKGKYGEHGVIITSEPDLLIDCPNHMTDTIREMLKDDEVVEAVNAGLLGVRAYKYDTKNAAAGFAYGLEFIDF